MTAPPSTQNIQIRKEIPFCLEPKGNKNKGPTENPANVSILLQMKNGMEAVNSRLLARGMFSAALRVERTVTIILIRETGGEWVLPQGNMNGDHVVRVSRV